MRWWFTVRRALLALSVASAWACTKPNDANPRGDGRSASAQQIPSGGGQVGVMDQAKAGVSAPSEARTDSADARAARERLVRRIETFDKPWGESGDWDPRVLGAMRQVPRHLFMPGVSVSTAYQDTPYPIGHGQTISQPTVVALMTQALRLTGAERVLEIGTGSGYQAAVLSPLVAQLYSIEILAPLGEQARERLARLGYRNVSVRIGDGYRGWPEEAPFDRIILTAAPATMPAALISQLKEGGIIVAPVGEEVQQLVRWIKRGASLEKERLGAVRFVPMVPGKR